MQSCITVSLSRRHNKNKVVVDMKAKNPQKQLYIVISQTGTLLSRILKFITGAEYNHASISVSADLEQMYSFGLRHPYNPFWGGFVMESPHTGTFKRFSNTKIIVLALPISEELHREILKRLVKMYEHREEYHYNYLGLFLAGIYIHRRKDSCYHCSEFIKDILIDFQINGADKLSPVVHSTHFGELPDTKIIYQGKLSEYNAKLLP